MGQHNSLLCRNHIYDEINDNHKARLGPRKDSVVTLDVKINDLDEDDKNKKVEKENIEWSEAPTQERWLEETGWEQQRSRRREDILYNIFTFSCAKSEANLWAANRKKREFGFGENYGENDENDNMSYYHDVYEHSKCYYAIDCLAPNNIFSTFQMR